MPSTFSQLKIQLMANGENTSTWGDVTNLNLGTALEEAIVGSSTITFTGSNETLTLADTNASQPARNLRLNLAGSAGGAPRVLTVPAIEKVYIINNGLDQTITVQNATGTGMDVPAGTTTYLYNNGTNVVDAITYLKSLTLATPLDVASGGTNAATAATARVNLLPSYTGNESKVLALNSSATDVEWTTTAGAGDVSGPASSTNLAIATFSGTTGKSIINNPAVTISSGTITATGFAGSGAGLTTLSAANLSSGTVPTARLASGTASSSTYLRGDSTWAAISGAGTVTSVAAGNGMNFTTITGSGTVTMGTPATLTTSTTNNTTASSHTHAITVPIPASFAWTAGSTAGPTGSLTVTNSTAVSYAAIPSASGTTSGIITTGAQAFAGTKTFGSISAPAYNFTTLTSHFGSASSITSSVAGVSILNVTGTAVTCSVTNRCTLGTASILWGQIYSSVATISTSDENSKQDIAELDEAERRVAVTVKGLIKKFRFKDAVAEKGAAARIHVGVIAQEVQTAFAAEGLDASRYGLFCSDTWWEKEVQVERNGITSTEMLTSEISIDGYTERTRLGMRYEELLAFVISAL